MAVYKVHKRSKNFTVMSNHHLRNMNLSLKARGLLSTILSLPEDWNYSVDGLCRICKEEECAVNSALKELKNAGYVIVTKKQNDSGIFHYQYDIYEIPPSASATSSTGKSSTGKSSTGKSSTGKSSTGKSSTGKYTPILNTKELNTEELNTDKQNTKEQNTPPTPPQGGTVSAFAQESIFLETDETKADESTESVSVKSPKSSKGKKKSTDKPRKRFVRPTVEEVRQYCQERNNTVDPEGFIDFYASKGWKIGRDPMVDWKAAVRTWERNREKNGGWERASSRSGEQNWDWSDFLRGEPIIVQGGDFVDFAPDSGGMAAEF